jgi:aquaporin Z
MATKKAASTTKKTAKSKQTKTKVTTVKAVESTPEVSAAAVSSNRPARFSLSNAPLIAALIAEFVGTFLLAAAVIAGQGQPILVLFALAGVVLTVGALSGAYVNPALTVAGWVTRRLSGVRALGYIVAQILGAMLALVVLNMFIGAAPAPSAETMMNNAPELFKAAALPEGKEWYIFFAEFLGATVFGLAVANATRELKERTAAAFTVGLGIFLALMIAGSATAYLGGSAILNPAVAVSLQAFGASVWPYGVYVLGTTLGAVVGFVLYDLLRSSAQKDA